MRDWGFQMKDKKSNGLIQLPGKKPVEGNVFEGIMQPNKPSGGSVIPMAAFRQGQDQLKVAQNAELSDQIAQAPPMMLVFTGPDDSGSPTFDLYESHQYIVETDGKDYDLYYPMGDPITKVTL